MLFVIGLSFGYALLSIAPLMSPPKLPLIGILLSNVLEQLWEEALGLFEDDPPGSQTTTIRTIRRRHYRSGANGRRRSSRTQMTIPGAPNPDPPSVQLSRRTKYDVPDRPFVSQWEGLQKPIDRRVGLENEVMELRRRASAAAGEASRLREEKKWAIEQGNRAREFQLGL